MSIRSRIKKNSISWHSIDKRDLNVRIFLGRGAEERPPLNPEKETETPGFFFEILTLREFLRNPSILPFHSDWNVFNPHGAPSKISPLHKLERASGGMNGIIRSWYDHIPEQGEGGFNPDHSPARLPRVIIRG